MSLKTWKSNLKNLSVKEYEYLREICHLSKNVYNESVYNIRQHYFAEKTYLRYEANYYQMKDSKNYILLGSNISQQSMRAADQSFKSFFALMKKTKQGFYERWRVKLPGYLPKDGFYSVVFAHAGRSSLKDGCFKVPVSRGLKERYKGLKLNIKIPDYILGKKIHQIQIVPKHKGRYFEVRFIFDDVDANNHKDENNHNLDPTKALSIDLGVNNFATCVTTDGDSFIIDGRKIKSQNQWYNKELSRLSSIKDHQKIKGCTKKQYQITRKRNNQIKDFTYKASKYIVSYCLSHNVGNLVIGYNDGFQYKANLGKINNQQFVMIPYGQFKFRLEYLCKEVGINYVEQEESYTSKASFWDKDIIPTWNPQNPKQGNFSGKRIHRGLYQTKSGKILNADVNGALNILRKSNVVDLSVLYSRGEVLSPMRIKLS